MRRRSGRFLVLALLLTIGGCGGGGKPMPFPTPESEMGDHPGLFTGPAGAVVWHPGTDSQKPPQQQEQPPPPHGL